MDENLYFTQQKDICKRKQLKELFNQWFFIEGYGGNIYMQVE